MSWLREVIPSLAKTLPRWCWTVRGLRNSRAPMSGLDSPSRASRAIWVSWRPEHQPHRLRPQPPPDQPQHLRRGPVQPLLIIDDAHQRPLPRHLRQQPQDRQPDHQPIRRRPGTKPERDPQRRPLPPRQTPQPAQHRRAQLMQPRERQLHLRLHPRRPHHPATRRPPGQEPQQRRLAHPRLTTHHQNPALTPPHRRHQPAKHPALSPAADQHRPRPRPRQSAATRTAPTLPPSQHPDHSDRPPATDATTADVSNTFWDRSDFGEPLDSVLVVPADGGFPRGRRLRGDVVRAVVEAGGVAG